MNWEQFAAAESELAALGIEQIRATDLVLVGTIRRDGSVRISPVEAYIVRGELMLGMMWQSKKALDLVRDARVLVHSTVTKKDGTEGEFKLRGRAADLTDPALRQAYSDTLWEQIQWRPDEPYHLWAVEIEEAAFVRFEGEQMRVRKWRRPG